MKLLRAIVCLLFFATAAGLLSGCATDNADNTTAVPWNTPPDWAGPLPSNINAGR